MRGVGVSRVWKAVPESSENEARECRESRVLEGGKERRHPGRPGQVANQVPPWGVFCRSPARPAAGKCLKLAELLPLVHWAGEVRCTDFCTRRPVPTYIHFRKVPTWSCVGRPYLPPSYSCSSFGV